MYVFHNTLARTKEDTAFCTTTESLVIYKINPIYLVAVAVAVAVSTDAQAMGLDRDQTTALDQLNMVASVVTASSGRAAWIIR